MKRHISPLSRHLSDAYKDVRGVKVTTKGGNMPFIDRVAFCTPTLELYDTIVYVSIES